MIPGCGIGVREKILATSPVGVCGKEHVHRRGGAVAEWSKALLKREKINENQKIPGPPPSLGTFKKRKKRTCTQK